MIIVLAALLLAAAPAHAPLTIEPEMWSQIATGPDVTVYSLGPTQGPSPTVRRIWVRQEFSGPVDVGLETTFGEPLDVSSETSLIEVDCAKDQARTIEAHYFSGHGLDHELGFSKGAPGPWSAANPDTVDGSAKRAACEATPLKAAPPTRVATPSHAGAGG